MENKNKCKKYGLPLQKRKDVCDFSLCKRGKECLVRIPCGITENQCEQCVIETYSQYFPRPSIVGKPNRNTRTISVTNYFDLNRIYVRITGRYKDWLTWEKAYWENNQILPFGLIVPYIKGNKLDRAKKVRSLLAEHWATSPDEASRHLYNYYVVQALHRIPHILPKARGGQPYGRSAEEMALIRRASRHLYVFLLYWLPRRKRPTFIDGYIRRNSIECLPLLGKEQAVSACMAIIQHHFKLKLVCEDSDDPRKNFYDKYIAFKGLGFLKQAYAETDYPLLSPLDEIFFPPIRKT